MRSLITGSGIALPRNVVTNDALAKIMDTSDEWIRTRSGIEQRYFADPGQGSTALGSAASLNALASANVRPADIDAVVFATMTPDYLLPGNGPLLQAAIGLRNIPTYDIRQQCSGFVYGLDFADALIRSGKAKKILLVGAEVHSAFMPWHNGWDATIGLTDREITEEERAANTKVRDRVVLFGDAGGAVVIEASEDDSRGILATKLFSDGSDYEALYMQSPSFKERPFTNARQLAAGETIPVMDGREVFRQAVTKMPEAVRAAAAEAGVAVEDLAIVLVHQANLRIIEGVQKQLALPPERVPHNIERYGNTTAATLPLLYHECVEDGRIKRGDLIAFVALGSGLHWGAAIYRA